MQRKISWLAALKYAVAFGACLASAANTALAAAPSGPGAQPRLSTAIRQVAAQVLGSGDHRQQPFAIVDKRAAMLAVFNARGHLLGSSSVLLGSVHGDHSVPGVGDRAQTGRLRPGDATTPAGRFRSAPGHNHTGESVVWLDHDLAFAIHRLRPGAGQADRAKRLAAQDPGRKRVSAGCVVVPLAFYETVVQPLFGHEPGVVYVLPEKGPA